MAKITAPNKKYNGIVANVVFINGVGETSDSSLIGWFKEKGYNVEAEEKIQGEQKPIDKMSIDELKKLAEEKNIKGFDAMKKDELLKALKG